MEETVKEKQVKTDNELIAEFMGLPLTKQEPTFSGNREMKTVPFQKWQYHTSWDWLMPVVKKINDEGYEHDGFVLKMAVKKAVADVDIHDAYRFVVEFIKWYNSENQKVV